MASYEVSRDPRTRIVSCRILAFVPDGEADELASELRKAVTEARTRGPLRLLFDNRAGKVFSAHAKDALDQALKSTRQPGDRTAVLVSDSLNRLQAKRSMSEGACVFVSEGEAMDWLATA